METYKIIDMLCKGNPDAYAVIKGSGINGLLLVYGFMDMKPDACWL
mgnify:CR=1 FL=1